MTAAAAGAWCSGGRRPRRSAPFRCLPSALVAISSERRQGMCQRRARARPLVRLLLVSCCLWSHDRARHGTRQTPTTELSPETLGLLPRAPCETLERGGRAVPGRRRLRLRPLHRHRPPHQGLRPLRPPARTSTAPSRRCAAPAAQVERPLPRTGWARPTAATTSST